MSDPLDFCTTCSNRDYPERLENANSELRADLQACREGMQVMTLESSVELANTWCETDTAYYLPNW